ncbi:hypothetical protein F5Y17DRAFT_460153 [Xylariaceae sp. FL0594]|nr:hypothetical protein F5Y17DRAFT_460153 [Xylariaceae sp. FL0594]
MPLTAVSPPSGTPLRTDGFSEELCKFIVDAKYEQLDGKLIDKLKDVVTECVGISVGAAAVCESTGAVPEGRRIISSGPGWSRSDGGYKADPRQIRGSRFDSATSTTAGLTDNLGHRVDIPRDGHQAIPGLPDDPFSIEVSPPEDGGGRPVLYVLPGSNHLEEKMEDPEIAALCDKVEKILGLVRPAYGEDSQRARAILEVTEGIDRRRTTHLMKLQ